MKNLTNKIYNQGWQPVGMQVWEQVDWQVREQVYDQVYDQVEEQVWQQVRRQVERQVWVTDVPGPCNSIILWRLDADFTVLPSGGVPPEW